MPGVWYVELGGAYVDEGGYVVEGDALDGYGEAIWFVSKPGLLLAEPVAGAGIVEGN